MIEIKYVKKEKLFPAFGLADEKKQTVYIRKDLPKKVKDFVLNHELYHLKDFKRLKKKNKKYKIIWGEIKANLLTSITHPIGFLYTVILSLHPIRLKLYIDLYITKKFNHEKFEKQLK
ncbi:MAG: hypothetical protein PF542_06135 [Nanoarchaeota archaeon]|jgi:tetrahydromethanopterin S-methyltransferase subunit G|nr:hypothetical protein [Nanoarchaeota archaeon]